MMIYQIYLLYSYPVVVCPSHVMTFIFPWLYTTSYHRYPVAKKREWSSWLSCSLSISSKTLVLNSMIIRFSVKHVVEPCNSYPNASLPRTFLPSSFLIPRETQETEISILFCIARDFSLLHLVLEKWGQNELIRNILGGRLKLEFNLRGH